MAMLESNADVLQNMENYIKEQALKEFFYASLLPANVSEIESDINPVWKKIVQTWHVDESFTMLASKLIELLNKENHPFNPMLKKHLGRPVYTLDCRHLCKGNAIGWLEKVANLPKSPKPILVIENITEIPEEDANHDNPQDVRNLLMHSWKNPMNDLYNANSRNSFKIVPIDYTIFITWTPENRGKMDVIHQPSDGFALIGNLEDYYKKFLAPYRGKTLEELEKRDIISYEQ